MGALVTLEDAIDPAIDHARGDGQDAAGAALTHAVSAISGTDAAALPVPVQRRDLGPTVRTLSGFTHGTMPLLQALRQVAVEPPAATAAIHASRLLRRTLAAFHNDARFLARDDLEAPQEQTLEQRPTTTATATTTTTTTTTTRRPPTSAEVLNILFYANDIQADRNDCSRLTTIAVRNLHQHIREFGNGKLGSIPVRVSPSFLAAPIVVTAETSIHEATRPGQDTTMSLRDALVKLKDAPLDPLGFATRAAWLVQQAVRTGAKPREAQTQAMDIEAQITPLLKLDAFRQARWGSVSRPAAPVVVFEETRARERSSRPTDTTAGVATALQIAAQATRSTRFSTAALAMLADHNFDVPLHFSFTIPESATQTDAALQVRQDNTERLLKYLRPGTAGNQVKHAVIRLNQLYDNNPFVQAQAWRRAADSIST